MIKNLLFVVAVGLALYAFDSYWFDGRYYASLKNTIAASMSSRR